MRKSLAIILTIASVVAIPAGCSQQKGLVDGVRISPETHIASGRMLEAQRNFPGAAEQYRQAIEAQPGLTIAYHRLAELYLKLGRFDDARQTLRTAIESGADEASLRNNLGFTLLRLERYDEAEQMFEAALAISPDFHRARMNLALLHARAGRIDASVREFEKLLPRADALYNVAVIRLQQRDYLTAAWGFGEAAELNPNLADARMMYEKARFLAQHSPQPAAGTELLAAINIPPQSREPEVVETAPAIERPAPRPAIVQRAPVQNEKARPVTSTVVKARIEPTPVAPTPAPTAEPVRSTPAVAMMRDISSSVRKAAVAVAPILLNDKTQPAATTSTAPAPIKARQVATDDSTPIESVSINVPKANPCDASPMTPVQLSSAHPAKSSNPKPMKPVTTE